MTKRQLIAAVMLAALLVAPAWVTAGGTGPLRKFWKKQPPIPPAATSGYTPTTARVVVVDPVPYGSLGGGSFSLRHPSGPTWRQDNLAAPMYPWGWFGARRGSQTTVQTRYYEDAVDWKFGH